MGHDSYATQARKAPFSDDVDWVCYQPGILGAVTLTNRNLSLDPESPWICTEMSHVVETAKAAYYISKTLRYLELLAL